MLPVVFICKVTVFLHTLHVKITPIGDVEGTKENVFPSIKSGFFILSFSTTKFVLKCFCFFNQLHSFLTKGSITSTEDGELCFSLLRLVLLLLFFAIGVSIVGIFNFLTLSINVDNTGLIQGEPSVFLDILRRFQTSPPFLSHPLCRSNLLQKITPRLFQFLLLVS